MSRRSRGEADERDKDYCYTHKKIERPTPTPPAEPKR